MNEREIFAAVLQISSEAERQAFLDEVCENEDMRQRLTRLLKEQPHLGSFLEHPPVAYHHMDGGELDPSFRIGEDLLADEARDTISSEAPSLGAKQPDLGEEIPLGYLQPSTRHDSIGRLDHYEILEVVGKGAFGTVLRAFDEKLQRVVAIKVLAPEMASTSPARKRFLREARSSAAVRHENVVAIHAVEDARIPYLVMEYIPGKTLQQRLDEQGPLDLPEILRIGKQIADGLAAAHQEGLIHRDIKPGNILLERGPELRVKITDFGLARTADDASMTQSGVIAGTPMYMAPEQAHGQKLDQRADLFSFGSVLYQMVSGRPPFRAPTTMAVLKRVTQDTPRPIQEIIPEAPPWMCELIGHLHAKEADHRYSSAQEVSELLARCALDLQAGRTPTVPHPTRTAAAPAELSPQPSKPTLHPNRRWRIASPVVQVAAVLLLLIGALGISEATGVTQWTSTVIRLATGSGTLVIETDDPNIKVAIDGEELSISGGGVEELKLRTGTYHVAALKDGKAVKQEIVSITRNGRAVLRLSLESPQEPPLAESLNPPSTQASFSWPADAPPLAIAPFDAEEAKAHQEAWAKYLGLPVERTVHLGQFQNEDVMLKMVLIPPGEFLMGSSEDDLSRFKTEAKLDGIKEEQLAHFDQEGPQHRVTITRPFYLSTTEFTNRQFECFVAGFDAYQTVAERDGKGGIVWRKGRNQRDVEANWTLHRKHSDRLDWPVVFVNSDDARLCAQWLSKKDPALTFSLPTEAQWEYACRAGTTTPWYAPTRKELVAQFAHTGNIAGGFSRVGTKSPNAFGLFDMHGNVWELCLDAGREYSAATLTDPIGDMTGFKNVMRGGHVYHRKGDYYNLTQCRSAARVNVVVTNIMFDKGFRLAAAISDEWIQDKLAISKRTFQAGEWIDLISLIDPELDKWDLPRITGENRWHVENKELIAAAVDARAHKLNFPLDSNWSAFELELELTRLSGESGFVIDIPTPEQQCPLFIGEYPSKWNPVDTKGRVYIGPKSKAEVVADEVRLENGKRTKLRFEVRNREQGSVTVWQDDQQIGQWQGACSRLALAVQQGYPSDRLSSLFIPAGEFRFHSIRLRMLDGTLATTVRARAQIEQLGKE